jgi:hypothetical protein
MPTYQQCRFPFLTLAIFNLDFITQLTNNITEMSGEKNQEQ